MSDRDPPLRSGRRHRLRGSRLSRLDAPDAFVHDAVRACASRGPLPTLPGDDAWITRAVSAGVLLPILAALRRQGAALPVATHALRTLTAARQMTAEADLTDLARVLDAQEVPWALLKGPVLGSVVYQHPQTREYTDLDVLVDVGCIDQSVRALVQAGAQLIDTDWSHVIRGRTAEIALVLPRGTVLDLHWHLVNLGRTRDHFELPITELLDRRVHRPIANRLTPTLDDLDLVLHVLLHGCLSGAHQLRWLLDAQQCVAWLASQGGTPPSLAGRARERNLEAPIFAMLDLVATHLDSNIRPWALAVRANRWTRLLCVVTAHHPPSSPSISLRTNRTLFKATRPTTVASLIALLRTVILTMRFHHSGWPASEPQPAGLEDLGYRTWLDHSEGTGRPARELA